MDPFRIYHKTQLWTYELDVRRVFIPTGKVRVKRNGDLREEVIPITLRKLRLLCHGEEAVVFNFTKRKGGITISDSRDGAKMEVPSFVKELERMLGHDRAEMVVGELIQTF